MNMLPKCLENIPDSPGAHRGRPEADAAETWTAVRDAAGATRALLTIVLPARKLGAALRAVKVAAISQSLTFELACESSHTFW